MDNTVLIVIVIILLAVIIYFGLKRLPDLKRSKTDPQKNQENDAKRFARLLVAEISLYNEDKVRRGLKNNNLYDSLQIEIGEARKQYKKRAYGIEFEKYFDEALIDVLAGGDRSKFGINFNS